MSLADDIRRAIYNIESETDSMRGHKDSQVDRAYWAINDYVRQLLRIADKVGTIERDLRR